MSEKTFNNVKITSSFNVPKTRENLVSGETIGKHFGKIAKVIEDLENGEFGSGVSIDDTSTTDTNKTWSAKKISESIPTSLPANGGNAATVGGKTIDSFIYPNGYYTDNVDDIKRPYCGVVTNTNAGVPVENGSWGTIICFAGGTGSWVQMWISGVDNDQTISPFYIRHFNGNIWSKWGEISTTPLKSTTVSGTTNAYSDLIISKTSSGQIPVFVAYADTYCTPFLSPAGYYYAHMVSAYGNDMGNVAINSATVYYIQM